MRWRIYFPSLAALAALLWFYPTAGAVVCLVGLYAFHWAVRQSPTESDRVRQSPAGSGDPLGFFSGK